MTEQYGLKTVKIGRDSNSSDRRDSGFNSATATYMLVKSMTVVATGSPHIATHGMGYVPRILVFEILSDHNRKLPYFDESVSRDFSVTKDDIKIRGATSGTFKVFIFAQGIL